MVAIGLSSKANSITFPTSIIVLSWLWDFGRKSKSGIELVKNRNIPSDASFTLSRISPLQLCKVGYPAGARKFERLPRRNENGLIRLELTVPLCLALVARGMEFKKALAWDTRLSNCKTVREFSYFATIVEGNVYFFQSCLVFGD